MQVQNLQALKSKKSMKNIKNKNSIANDKIELVAKELKKFKNK